MARLLVRGAGTGNGNLIAGPRELAPFAGDARRSDDAVSRRIDSGPENAERGLAQLVLTLVEQRMEELKQTFGLTGEDLNLDLGPLRRLL